MKKRFLFPFRDFILERVPTNPSFALSLSERIFSTVIGRNLVVITKKAPLRLNLFCLYIAPSGLGEKSIPLREYARPLLRRTASVIGEGHQFIIPEHYTSEGIQKYFTEEKVGVNGLVRRDVGLIAFDEFAQFFADLRNKKYMRDAIYTLTRLYDGRLPGTATIKHGHIPNTDVYVNLVSAASIPILGQLDRDFFLQGCGNRFLYILDKPEDISSRIKRSPKDYFSVPGEDEREKGLERFAKRLKRYYDRSKKCTLYVDEPAQKLLIDYELRMKNLASKISLTDPFDLRASYVARRFEFVSKLSALKCIDRKLAEKKYHKLIDIEVKDVKWATKQTRHYYNQFQRLLSYWEMIEYEKRKRVTGQLPDQIKYEIAKAGGWIAKTDLRRKMDSRNVSPEQLHSILGELTRRREIIIKEQKLDPHRPGPIPTYIVLKHAVSKFKEELKKEETVS